MKKQWKKQMQQKMADFEEPDIVVSWSELEKALATNRGKASIIPLWSKRFAVAAAVVLAVGIGYRSTTDYQTAPDRQTPSQQITKVTEQATEEISLPEQNPSTSPQKSVSTTKKTYHQGKIKGVGIDELTDNQHPASQVVDGIPASNVQETTTDHAQESPSSQSPVIKSDNRQQKQTIYPSELRKARHPKNRLTATVYYSNTMGCAGHTSEIDIGETSPGNIPSEHPDDSLHNGQPRKIMSINKDGEMVTHHLPLRFGFSLRYNFDRRWGLESGIIYTRHTSDIITLVGTKRELVQRLNYVGIPLKASYSFVSNRHFNVYLSAGAMAEKMIKGTSSADGFTKSVSIHPLQVSLNTSVGAEWRINRLASIFVEPSLNYYIDNGSQIHTIYQDKPLNFGFNVGMRFNFGSN